MKIVWDEPKRFANLDKHGLDFADLMKRFSQMPCSFLQRKIAGKGSERIFGA